MTIEGPKIRCDECGDELNVPMNAASATMGTTISQDERVRAYASGFGWNSSSGIDGCERCTIRRRQPSST